MTNIAVIYFSGTGHTHLMADAVATGVQTIPDTKVQLLRITGEQIVNGRWKDEAMVTSLNSADAIIFGSPTYMGGVAAQFKAFVDYASSIWAQQLWKDKIAGGFTHSSSLSGDKQGTLLYLAINASQHSMIWVSAGDMPQPNGVNRLGSFIGVMGQAVPDFTGTKTVELDTGDRLSCESYGQRIAAATKRWQK
ncbi:flavodoxin family protein [Chamaesiphon sp.]|uniref:flavodoxin family protein n=1 Tax=Chamaesiphon sp. TaxID=2814140 RepID=UPI003593A9F6